MLDCNSKHSVDLVVCMTTLKETDQNVAEAAELLSLTEIGRLDLKIQKKHKKLRENLQINDYHFRSMANQVRTLFDEQSAAGQVRN